MGKRVCLVLGLVVGLLAPAAPVAGVAGFGDVEPERYYTEPVQWMVDDHIVETDNSACFAPNIAASRGDTRPVHMAHARTTGCTTSPI